MSDTSATSNVTVDVSLVSLENGDDLPALAWATVNISINGVDIEIDGIAIVREGLQLVCRTPHHIRDNKWASSIGVPKKIADAISEVVFSAYDRGMAIPAPLRLPRALLERMN